LSILALMRTPTPFESRVYEALTQIPRGRVTTYGLLAVYLDCGSARAVGQALRRNPNGPRVPCHRVVRADLSLGGYAGATAGATWRRKHRLLEQEGIPIEGNCVASREYLYDFS